MDNNSKKTGIAIVIAIIVVVVILLVSGVIDLSEGNMNEMNNDLSLSEASLQIINDSGVGIEEGITGEGDMLLIGNEASVHYKGTLEDGTEFDSSYGKDPLVFIYGTGQLIPGFEIGMLEMKVGSKRTIKVPAELGYGDREVGQIPANSDLIFEIELVDVKEMPQN